MRRREEGEVQEGEVEKRRRRKIVRQSREVEDSSFVVSVERAKALSVYENAKVCSMCGV